MTLGLLLLSDVRQRRNLLYNAGYTKRLAGYHAGTDVDYSSSTLVRSTYVPKNEFSFFFLCV